MLHHCSAVPGNQDVFRRVLVQPISTPQASPRQRVQDLAPAADRRHLGRPVQAVTR